MEIFDNIDWKSFIIGTLISAIIALIATKQGIDWLFLFSAIGIFYVGYKGKNLIYGSILGAISSIPLAYLTSVGGLGPITDSTMMITSVLAVFIVGGIIGFIGAYSHRDRQKALAEYEKKQKIGKKKKKNKK